MAEAIDLRHTIAVALHDAGCSDHHCTPTVMGEYFERADALLAAHDAQVKAEAWDEGAQFMDEDHFWYDDARKNNPYRTAETEAGR